MLVYFRNTLASLTAYFCKSTFPIVWDDPSSASEVKQVAIDLANGAARSKKDETTKPTTGCLITANFDCAELTK